jgi:hypothetical protein
LDFLAMDFVFCEVKTIRNFCFAKYAAMKRKRACNSGEMQARDNGTKSDHELKLDDVFVFAKADDVTVALLF